MISEHIDYLQVRSLSNFDRLYFPFFRKDLQIRVCGWNVLWNNICRQEQDVFIRQAESLV